MYEIAHSIETNAVRIKSLRSRAPTTITRVKVWRWQRPGERILVIEDEPLVGANLSRTLARGGYTVVGPYASVAEAIVEIKPGIDAAVFDLNRRGHASVFAMHALDAAHKPFIIVTALSRLTFPPLFRDRPRMAKPYFPGTLYAALELAMNAAAPDRTAVGES